MPTAPLGAPLLVAGVTASAWQVERVETMHPGASVDIAGYSFRLEGAQPLAAPHYTAQRGRLTAARHRCAAHDDAAEKAFLSTSAHAVDRRGDPHQRLRRSLCRAVRGGRQ